MKSVYKIFVATLLALLSGNASLRAQWSTQLTETSSNYHVTDISFYGNSGYATSYRIFTNHSVLFRTTDGGLNWDSIAMPSTISNYYNLSYPRNIVATGPDTIYVNVGASDTQSSYAASILLKSTDRGASWSIWLSSTDRFFTTWQFISPLEAFAFSQSGFSPYYLFHHTTDGGQTWTQTVFYPSGPIISAPYDMYMDASGLGAITEGNLLEQTTNSGNTWSQVYNDNNANFRWNDLFFVNSSVGYAVGDSLWPGEKIMKTTDGGLTWQTVSRVPDLLKGKLYFINSQIGYIGGNPYSGGPAMYKTTNGGLSWTPETYPASALTHIAGFTKSGNNLYAIDDSVTTNSGFKIYANTFASNCAVDAGPDTTFCQLQGQLHATPLSSGNYIYEWMPAIGLDDPYSQNPTVISGVNNQMYVVAMTDTITNCTASDTVYVNAYYFYLDTIYSCNNAAVTLDYGPGATSYYWQYYTDPQGNTSPIFNQNNQTLTVTQPGSYSGFALFTGCGALTSVFWVIDSCAAAVCAVDAGPDTTFCQLQGQLHAIPLSSGNNYIYSWSPANGLDNPNSQYPTVISGVNNQQYVVTMTDTVTNCTAYDTVYVSAYYWTIDTIYNCNNAPVILDFGPGASNYFWQYFTDTAGNTTNLNVNTQTFAATQPGTYLGFAVFPGCGALTSLFTVIDSCTVYIPNVWPGDCNYDLIANAADVLHIGLAYNATGATRPAATNGWYAQPMTDWSQNFVNCNYKHADCDGNGIVDVNDTLAVSLNYSLTHPYRFGPPQVNPLTTPALELVANYDTVGLQTLVTVDIRLGSSAIPVDSIYGISFRITSDALLIDTTLTVANLNSTWLGTPGTDMFHFRKNFADAGTMDIAECGTNHINRLNGSGSIGSFLIVTTDNLSGIAICHFDLSEITAVTVSQHYLSLNAVSDSVVIDPSVPAGIRNENAISTFTCYPNPANNQVTVQLNKPADAIEILDMTGRVISSVKPTGKNTTIETSGIANGMYLLRVQNGNSISSQKLTISH